MADISKITIPLGTYDIKDRSALATLSISNNTITGTTRGGATVSVTVPNTKVTLAVGSADAYYPVLSCPTANKTSGTTTTTALYHPGLRVNPNKKSVAEGSDTTASGNFSHAEGYETTASSDYSHAEGECTFANGYASHAEGECTTASGDYSHAEGEYTFADGYGSHAEGSLTTASGEASHAEGADTNAIGNYSHTEGRYSITGGDYTNNVLSTIGEASDSGAYAHAEGNACIAVGVASHAEGLQTFAGGKCSHVEGFYASTIGNYSHAEGNSTSAGGIAAHAEGTNTQATEDYSHAEGQNSVATGVAAHAEGISTNAGGEASHAGGYGTIANVDNVTVIGQYNATCSDGDLFVVGNGGTNTTRKTVFKVASNTATTTGGYDCIVTVSGKVNATTGFYQTSDKRQKNIIGEIDLLKAYDLIDKCQEILYILKDDDQNKELIGLIAQEVNEYFPEVIGYDKDGMMSLDYARLTVVILRVLKDVIKRLEKLESK